jgi:hypothetical protein
MYGSEASAKAAHRTVKNRIRAYRCPDCNAYHVTDADKRHSTVALEVSHHITRRSAGALAPPMTLEQVQAIAAQKRSQAA